MQHYSAFPEAPAYASTVGYQNETMDRSFRTLTTSLDRLRVIAETIEGANERSGRFLDTLVGAELQKGEGSLPGGQIEVNSYIAELHRLIDRVERAASVADARAFRLLAATDDGIAQGSAAKMGTIG